MAHGSAGPFAIATGRKTRIRFSTPPTQDVSVAAVNREAYSPNLPSNTRGEGGTILRSTVRLVGAVLLILSLPLIASAQTEPYSTGTVPQTSLASGIDVVVSGLTVTLSVSGAGDCEWDFGDDTAGTGNPVSHTYDADGNYSVTATCGTAQYQTTVAVGSLARTGSDIAIYFWWGASLLVVGGAIVLFARRFRS